MNENTVDIWLLNNLLDNAFGLFRFTANSNNFFGFSLFFSTTSPSQYINPKLDKANGSSLKNNSLKYLME